jgi:predicted phage-related endonuclease
MFAEGHEWEAAVREQAFGVFGYTFTPMVAIHPDHPRFFASLDGVDEANKMLLEVKTVTSLERYEEYKKNPPQHYLAQVQWQMFVTGYTQTILAFTHNGEVHSKIINANERFQRELYAVAHVFLTELDAIKEGIMPSPVTSLASPEMDRIAFLKGVEKEMKLQLDMVSEEIKTLAEKALSDNSANKIESDRVTIQVVERQGSIDYGAVPQLKGLDLSSYRKKGSKFVQVNLK